MTGRRTWRWLDRLRAAVGRRPSQDSTAPGTFSARSQPPGVTNPPPNATLRAPDARARPTSAPTTRDDRDTPAPVEAREGTVTPGADGVVAPPVPHEARDAADAGGASSTSSAGGTRPDDTAGPDPADPSAPPVRVHEDRLERGVAPMELSPTEALRLATEGHVGLSRRDLPPDTGRD